MIAALFYVFAAVFLLAPFWDLAKGGWQKAVCAAVTGGLGLGWAWVSAGAVTFQTSRRDLWLVMGGIGLVLALNALAITSDLAWKGDEDHHFKTAKMFASFLNRAWPLHVLALLPLVVVAASRRIRQLLNRAAWIVLPVLALIATIGALGLAWMHPEYDPYLVSRYPVLTAATVAWPVTAVGLFGWVPEAAYRLVSVLSVALIGILCARKLPLPLPAQWLCVLAFATVPTLFYYSSLLYPEIPALLCMTVAILSADRLVTAPLSEVRTEPGWVALVLVGFIKESSITFLLAVVLCRWGHALRQVVRRRQKVTSLLGEMGASYAVLLPYAVFAFYRLTMANVHRGYAAEFDDFLTLETYAVMLRAFWTEYATAVLLLPIGVLVLARARRFGALAFLGIGLLSYGVLHIMDLDSVLGYSRYMLMFAPLVVFAAVQALTRIASLWRTGAIVTLIVMLLVHLAMSPMHLDGSREPGWGEYRYNWSEHSYPYRSALRYVARQYPTHGTLIAGLVYQYWHQFYVGETNRFRRLPKQHPDDATDLTNALLVARRFGFRHLIYHVSGNTVPHPLRPTGYELEKVFQNKAHTLALYSYRR